MALHRLSTSEIEKKIDRIAQSPRDLGTLECIVLRLPNEKRETPQEAVVSPDGGLHGDRWRMAKSPNQRGQISMMNASFQRTIAGDEDRMTLAGDNLLVDLDLNKDNLPTGARLRIGSSVVEVTDLPHTGCSKFERRYGIDALNFTSSHTHKFQRLRGLFVRTIKPGLIRVGDTIIKIQQT